MSQLFHQSDSPGESTYLLLQPRKYQHCHNSHFLVFIFLTAFQLTTWPTLKKSSLNWMNNLIPRWFSFLCDKISLSFFHTDGWIKIGKKAEEKWSVQKNNLQKVLPFYISFLESPGWGQGGVRNATVPTKPRYLGVHRDTEQKHLSEASKHKNSCKINKTKLHPSLQRVRTTWTVLIQLFQ